MSEDEDKDDGTLLSTGVLEKKSLVELAAMYNEITGADIKKFESREVAVRRILKALKEKSAVSSPPDAPAPKKGSGRRRKLMNYAPRKLVLAHRGNTNRARALELLLGGGTMEQVMSATGWNERQAIEGVRLLHRHLGYGLSEDKAGFIKAIRP